MGLFELSDFVRKIIAGIFILILAIILLWILWPVLRSTLNVVLPTQTEVPKTSFGRLNPPDLPNTNVDLSKTTFNLDLEGGKSPEVPLELSVYPITNPTSNDSNLENAKEIAKKYDLIESPKKLSSGSYLWTDVNIPARSLKINIITGEYTYTFDSTKDTSILNGKFEITESELIDRAKNFLNEVDSFPQDFEGGKTKVNLFKQKGKKRVKVSSLTQANAVEVLFFRKPLEDKYELVGSNLNSSLIKIVLSPNSSRLNGVLDVRFVNWSINFGGASLYPLKSADTALGDFQKGKASFVIGAKKSFTSINVADVSIAYFETRSFQPYLQPIFVFKGTGITQGKSVGFIAYLPAVNDEFIEGTAIF